PVHGPLVGAGPADRLRGDLHPPGGRLPRRRGQGQAGDARLPRRLPDAAGPRRGAAVGEGPEVGRRGEGVAGHAAAGRLPDTAETLVSAPVGGQNEGGHLPAREGNGPGRWSLRGEPWLLTRCPGGDAASHRSSCWSSSPSSRS